MPDYVCVAKLDAEGQHIYIQLHDPTTGDIIATSGIIDLDLTDLTGTNKFARFREIVYQDKDCAWKKRWVLCTEEEASEAPA